MAHALSIKDLKKTYANGFQALKGISLDVSEGDFFALLGPNGAGKSTTMRILSGCLGASEGEVQLNGIDLAQAPLQAKRAIGYLPETPPLHHDMTVNEYLSFCARLKAVPGSGVKSALESARSRCGLEREGNRLIRNLSKGYQQRVGIAQAIIHSPRIIVLDEPTSGLDPNQIVEIRELIRMLGSSHAVILSTHILPEVQSVCDRVAIMNDGRLIYTERLSEINDNSCSALLIRLAGSPGEDLIARLEGVSGVTALGNNRFRLELDGMSDTAAVARQIVNREWGLLELLPEDQSLERIFYRLTTTEENGA